MHPIDLEAIGLRSSKTHLHTSKEEAFEAYKDSAGDVILLIAEVWALRRALGIFKEGVQDVAENGEVALQPSDKAWARDLLLSSDAALTLGGR